ncbi:MAG: GAF domain-containing protein, partial [Anaerolineae bacterium]|nr:GAF domain-containing protein [Anaerolineae bacterium]
SRVELRESLSAQDVLNQQLARMNDDLTQRSAHLRAAAQISQVVTSVHQTADLLKQVVQALYTSFDMHAVVFLRDESGEQMTVAASSSDTLGEVLRISIDRGTAAGRCVAEVQPCLVAGADLVRAGYHLPETRFEAAIPLLSRGEQAGHRRAIGVLDLQKADADPLDEQEMSILTTIADQIASGITSIRAEEETRQALQDLEQLRQRYVGESWDQLAPRLQAAGYRWSGGGTLPLGHRLLPEAERVVSIQHPVMQEGKLVVPISYGGHVLGVLGVDDPANAAQWSDDAVALVESVAEQMGQALENARLFEDAQARLAEITALQQNLLRESWEDYVSIKEERDFVFRQPGVSSLDVVPAEAEQVLRNKSSVSWTKEDNGDSETAFVAPIDRRGQVIGMLGLQEVGINREWSDEEIEIVQAVTSQLSSAIENAQLFESLQQRAAEIERVAEQLRETDQFRAEFLATMSHELRTPLNSIIGFSRVMLKGIDGPLNEMQKTDLEAIYNNGQNLLRLINDVLDQSKIDAGKMELLLENDVDVSDLLDKEVRGTLAVQIGEKPIEPVLNVASDMPAIRADSTRIRQVLRNLMSNAAKFTEEGSITVSAWCEEDLVYISVEDTGIGMQAEKIDLVFEKFRQLDSSSTRAAEGTGLGMPISRTLVEMHGGRIWVESEEGVGSKFTFFLPVAGPMAEEIPELADLAIDKAKKMVLVIERDDSEVATYRRYLDSVGYQLVGLFDPQNAVRWSRHLNPFVILMDVELGGDQGWHLLETLKSTRHTRMTPVVVCSRSDVGAEAINMGAAAFVRKPVVAKQMLELLSRLAGSA